MMLWDLLVLKDSADPEGFHAHQSTDDASPLIEHDDEQPDKHPIHSAYSGSDASCRAGLAIQC